MRMYKKLYGIITEYTPDRMVVLLDNGVTAISDGRGYLGKFRSRIAIGRRVKLYQRPQDRRPWVYKLVGE
jgi:hypothetical protein